MLQSRRRAGWGGGCRLVYCDHDKGMCYRLPLSLKDVNDSKLEAQLFIVIYAATQNCKYL